MWPWDIPSSFVNFSSIRGTFRKHSVWPQDLPSTCVNISYVWRTFRPLSFRPQEVLSTSVDFPCGRGTFQNFHQFSVHTLAPPASSVNLLFESGTFHQLLSTFLATAELSINCLCTRRSTGPLQSSFCVSAGRSVKFCQLFVHLRDLHQLSSTVWRLWEVLSTLVNFLCVH